MSEISNALSDLKASWQLESNKLAQSKQKHSKQGFNWPVFILISVVLFFILGPGSLVAAFVAIKIMEAIKNKNHPAVVSGGNYSGAISKLCDLSDFEMENLTPARRLMALEILQKAKVKLLNSKRDLEELEDSSTLGARALNALKVVVAGVAAVHTLADSLTTELRKDTQFNEEAIEKAKSTKDYLYFTALQNEEKNMDKAVAAGLISESEQSTHLLALKEAKLAFCCQRNDCALPKSDIGQYCRLHTCINPDCKKPAAKFDPASIHSIHGVKALSAVFEAIGYDQIAKLGGVQAHACSSHYDDALEYFKIGANERSAWR